MGEVQESFSLEVVVRAIGARKGSVLVGAFRRSYTGSVISCRIGMCEDADISLLPERVPFRILEKEVDYTRDCSLEVVVDRKGVWYGGNGAVFYVPDASFFKGKNTPEEIIPSLVPVHTPVLLVSHEEIQKYKEKALSNEPIKERKDGSENFLVESGTVQCSWIFSLGAFVHPIVQDGDGHDAYAHGRMQRFMVAVMCKHARQHSLEERKGRESFDRCRSIIDTVLSKLEKEE